MMSAKEISHQLALRVEDVSRYLLPNGKKQGYEWCVGSVSGEEGASLKVHLGSNKPGIWCDFATSDKGDLLDLWAIKRNLTIYEAMKEATHYLGISFPHFEAYKIPNFVKPQQKFPILSQESSVAQYLMQDRKLCSLTIQAYKISQHNDEIVFPYYKDNQILFIKYLKLGRINGKKQMRVAAGCEPCLFGWQAIPGVVRSVTICEGEIDALSLWQYGFPALSVPFGGGKGDNQRWIEYEYERLNQFDEIFVCMDNDDVGNEAKLEIIDRLGAHRCRIVILPLKDANECLKSRISKQDIENCFNEADYSPNPEELKPANAFTQQVIEEFYPSGVCQQRCRVTLKKNYFSTSSILTHRVRGLSTAITHAIQALLFRQFYVKAYIII